MTELEPILDQIPEDALSRIRQRWDNSASLNTPTLIRLAMLRDLVRTIHASKSQFLAEGKRDKVLNIKLLEARIEDLKNSAVLEGTLSDLLRADYVVKKRTRVLPEALFLSMDREKLTRYDRTWEAVIASEAVDQGWCFWNLNIWVEMGQVEEFHHALSERLTPHGIVLFTESAADAGKPSAVPPRDSLWLGRWWILLESKYRTPEFGVSTMPGVSSQPALPHWKLFFTPKKR